MLWIMKVSNLFEKIFEIIFQWPYIKSVIRHQTNIICTWIYQHDQNIIIIMIMTPNNKLSYEEERSIYYDNIFLFSRKCHAIFHHRLTLWSFFSKTAGASASATNFASSHLWKITDKNNRFFPPISMQTKKTYNICLYQFLWVNIYLIYYPFL